MQNWYQTIYKILTESSGLDGEPKMGRDQKFDSWPVLIPLLLINNFTHALKLKEQVLDSRELIYCQLMLNAAMKEVLDEYLEENPWAADY